MSLIKIKRSAVSGKVPLDTDLELGELAINTYDGKLFLKKSVAGANTIVDVTASAGGATNLTVTANSTTTTVLSDTGTDATIAAANSTTAGVITAEAQTIGGVKAYTHVGIYTDNTQLQLRPASSGTSPTVLFRNDSADFYILKSANGSSPSGTWDTSRPFTINLANGAITSVNGQIFSGGTIINDTLNVDSGTLYVDTANNRVGIGTSTPSHTLTVEDETNNIFGMREYSNNDGPVFRLFRAKGTKAAPMAVTADVNLGGIRAFGWDGSSFNTSPAAAIDLLAAETFTSTAKGTYITFKTTPIGASTQTEIVRIDSAGNVGIGTTAPRVNRRLTLANANNVSTGMSIAGTWAEDCRLEIGEGRSANGAAYVDLIGDTTYTDYGLRIIRNGGASSSIIHRGTGDFELTSSDEGRINMSAGGAQFILGDSILNATLSADVFTCTADIDLNGSLNEKVFTVTDGASVNLSPTNGTIQRWTLTASRTPVSPTNWPEGSSMTLMINDGTAYTITWTTMAPVWVGGSAPTLATSGWTVLTFWKVSTTIYGAITGNVA